MYLALWGHWAESVEFCIPLNA